MNTFEFDGKKYRSASRHQKEWGRELISQVSFSGKEDVLNLGSGDGILTEQLSRFVPFGTVLGIDASNGMIETANTLRKSNLAFARMDIDEINFDNEFDLIFSNAALHWLKDHKRLLKASCKALKAHGEIVWDFGGRGNCSNFINVIQEKITTENYAKYFLNFDWPWFMPSKEEYAKLLSAAGFSAYTIREINRDRYFSDASEMIRWIDQPCIVPFIKYIPETLKETFRQEIIEEMIKRTQQPNGACFETFRRIRVYARK